MAFELPDGNIARTLPEQVKFLTEKLIDLYAAFNGFAVKIKVVSELPETGDAGVIYMVPATDPETGNYYEEYLYISDAWELIGTTQTDLSGLMTLTTDQKVESNKTFAKDNYLKFATVAGDDKYFYLSSKNSNYFHIGAVGIATALILDTYLTNFSPDGNSQTLGTASKLWADLYLSGSLKDNNGNAVPIANIATKANPALALDLGELDSNGELLLTAAQLPEDGVYMLTYSYAQTVMYISKSQIDAAALIGCPVRASIPVVYNSAFSASPGNIRIDKIGSNYRIKISTGGVNAAPAHLYAIKTGVL